MDKESELPGASRPVSLRRHDSSEDEEWGSDDGDEFESNVAIFGYEQDSSPTVCTEKSIEDNGFMKDADELYGLLHNVNGVQNAINNHSASASGRSVDEIDDAEIDHWVSQDSHKPPHSTQSIQVAAKNASRQPIKSQPPAPSKPTFRPLVPARELAPPSTRILVSAPNKDVQTTPHTTSYSTRI